MLLIPTTVTFEELVFDDTLALTIDRQSARLVEEWSDLGPHAAFADAPERRTIIRLTRRPRTSEPDLIDALVLGRLGTITATVGRSAGAADARRLAAFCMLTSVRSDLSAPAASRDPEATQTLTFLAISPDGGPTDPITITSTA